MHRYLITSKEFYTDILDVFESKLYEQFKVHKPTYALYRDKTNPNYKLQALRFMEVCRQFEGIKSFIHMDVELAHKLHATGVHLTSNQVLEIEYAKSKGLEVIISTHTHAEVLKAEMLGADAVTYSPIFTSPGKGEPKGIEDLKELLKKCNVKVFALGGIVEEWQVDMVKKAEAYGFASIRYFY